MAGPVGTAIEAEQSAADTGVATMNNTSIATMPRTTERGRVAARRNEALKARGVPDMESALEGWAGIAAMIAGSESAQG